VTRRLGIDLAIDAVGVLKNRIPDIRLHLWERGGDYLKQLWSQQDELGAESFVVIHPVVPIEEIPGVMISMDIGIIPYGNSAANQVMLPVKMMEYVALGIPVVAPRLRAIQHYFNDRMVSFYEPGNVEQMADAIWRLYLDENLKKSQVRSARGFLEEYGWEKKSAEFIQFYMEMAK
jgi:glycosyltransferase involved in cell wall biosynthesis